MLHRWHAAQIKKKKLVHNGYHNKTFKYRFFTFILPEEIDDKDVLLEECAILKFLTFQCAAHIPLILPYFNVLEMSNFAIRECVHHSVFLFFF